MKQTLTEIAEILKEIDRGKKWEYFSIDNKWKRPIQPFPLAYLHHGSAIRLKPAEPDAEGWIPWKGGECPVPYNATVEYRMWATPGIKDRAVASALRWDCQGKDTDIIAYRPHKPEPECSPDPHPNRKEVEEGIKKGRKWQIKIRNNSQDKWETVQAGYFPTWDEDLEYRLAPEPEYAPLGPEDVPPGSVFRNVFAPKPGWFQAFQVYADGIEVDCEGNDFTWKILAREHEINRSLPLTGKWDATAWEPCRKLKPQEA